MQAAGRSSHFLWVIEFRYSSRYSHGAYLRYFNLSAELLRAGHRVTFAVYFEEDPVNARRYFEDMQARGVFTAFLEIVAPSKPQRPSGWRKILRHPSLEKEMLRSNAGNLLEAIGNREIDVFILSDRRSFFLTEEPRHSRLIALDICDSFALYWFREAVARFRAFNLRGLIQALRELQLAFLFERYYTRRADLNFVVSPVDKRALDRINGKPEKNIVVMNGVRVDGPADGQRVEKIAERIIFSGVMNFPPNLDAAMWFLDKVFPLIVRKRPSALLVLAGANPGPELLARANANVQVTGFVENMNREIARSALAIAPIVKGSGFRNKIVEAIANGTYVVSTSLGAEFFPASFKNLLTVADAPHDFADRIVTLLENPEAIAERLLQLQEIVNRQYTWSQRADELAQHCLSGLGA
jgi:glycosyltransferase involved in cell wall biosynthesis